MMIVLEARAPELNRLRSWRIEASPDLFGRWHATVTFGRIGRAGRSRQHAFAEEADLARFLRRALLRRRTATRRIGVGYVAVAASSAAVPLVEQLGFPIRPT